MRPSLPSASLQLAAYLWSLPAWQWPAPRPAQLRSGSSPRAASPPLSFAPVPARVKGAGGRRGPSTAWRLRRFAEHPWLCDHALRSGGVSRACGSVCWSATAARARVGGPDECARVTKPAWPCIALRGVRGCRKAPMFVRTGAVPCDCQASGAFKPVHVVPRIPFRVEFGVRKVPWCWRGTRGGS